MQMKAILFLSIILICLLSLSGTAQAQQEKGQGNMAAIGQSPTEYPSYMGGKEHYLADSPYYMAGKKHYLQGPPSSNSGKNGQGKEQIPDLRPDKVSKEKKSSEEQGGTNFQIEINIIPREPTCGFGIIALPDIRRKTKGGTVSSSPNVNQNPPQAGNFIPNVSGGFQPSTTNFR